MKKLHTMNPQADWTAIKTILSSQVFDSYTTGVEAIEKLMETLKELTAKINNTQDILFEYGCGQPEIFAINKLYEIANFIAMDKAAELTDSQAAHQARLKQLPQTIDKKNPLSIDTLISFFTNAVNDFDLAKEITVYLCVLSEQVSREVRGIENTLKEHGLHDETLHHTFGDMTDLVELAGKESFNYFYSMLSYFNQFRDELMATGNGVTSPNQAKNI